MTNYDTFPNVCVAKIVKYFDEDKHVGETVIFLNRTKFNFASYKLISLKDGKFLDINDLVSDDILLEYVSTNLADLHGGNSTSGNTDCTCDMMTIMGKGCQCGGV